jgi:hypothetical protein
MRGVDEEGFLVLETGDGILKVMAGDLYAGGADA